MTKSVYTFEFYRDLDFNGLEAITLEDFKSCIMKHRFAIHLYQNWTNNMDSEKKSFPNPVI